MFNSFLYVYQRVSFLGEPPSFLRFRWVAEFLSGSFRSIALAEAGDFPASMALHVVKNNKARPLPAQRQWMGWWGYDTLW